MPNQQRSGFIPTRFPGGLNTTRPHRAMAMQGQPDPSRFITDYDDFLTYLATNWAITLVGAGGTKALIAGNGGLLSVANSAAGIDSTYYQRPVGSFLMVANKRTFFKARFSVDDATLADIQFGLIGIDTTPADATDGIFFRKAAGSTAIQVFVRKDGTTGSSTIANVGTMTTGFVEFAFHYDGKSEVEFFFNDVRVGSITNVLATTFLPDALLATSFGILNGSAVARTLVVDYILAAQER